jgi:hypothetical protein
MTEGALKRVRLVAEGGSADEDRLAARLFGKTYVTTRAEVERYRREQLSQVGPPPEPFALARSGLSEVPRSR